MAQSKRIDKCLIGTRHEHRNRALFFLGLGSGMRISEIVGLKVVDVMPHDEILSRIVLEKHGTKSKRSRTVAVSKQALKHLTAYLSGRQESEEFDEDTPLFPGQMNPRKPISDSGVKKVLAKMFEEAGVANVSSHSMRRTHANTLRRAGADLMIIKEQLGHSSLATTQHYFQADPLEIQSAVDKLKF